MSWNSTLNPGKPMQRKAFMKRSRESRNAGLGHRIAAELDFLKPHGAKPINFLRSEAHRRNVASLPCVVCRRKGTQAAHVNFGKSLGLKTCDSLTFPLCPGHHRDHDQGGVPRDERRRLEWEYVDWTRSELLKKNLWPRSVETHYQRAIGPLKRVSE